MKIVKYLLLGLGAVVAVAGGVLAYIAATFDPNEYKPQIIQAVKEKTQRTLTLAGDIDLTLFPSVGARLGKAALTERGSNKEFAAVEDLRVAVKLWPLLSREVIVDAVEVKGLRAHLVRFKNGTTNFQDLTGVPASAPAQKPAPAESAQVKIDIAKVRVENSAVSYVDQAKRARYEISRMNLTTGRLASGVPSDIELSFHAKADQPKLDLDARLKTRLAFDLQKQHFKLDGLDVAAKGTAAGLSGLDATVKGDVEANAARNEFSASSLAVTAKGRQGAEDFAVTVNLPRLSVTQDKVSGEKITLDASSSGANRKLSAKAEIPAIEGNAKAFRAAQVTATADLREQDAITRLKLASPLTGSIDRQQFELPKLTAAISAANPKFPKSPIEATLNGALVVDAAKQTAEFRFATKFDESTIDGRAGLVRFAPPAYTFDVNVDRLDADRYTGKSAQAKPAPRGDAPGQPSEQPIDVSALKGLDAKGSLKVGDLKVSGIKASNVRLQIKAANGRLEVSPIAANLYQGSLAGALAVNAAAAAPSFAVKQKLTGINVAPLLKDVADNASLEGKGDVTVDVTAQGNTVSALKKALNGTAAVRLTDGALKGINIAGSIRSAKAKLGVLRGEQVQQANKAEKTDFSELSATFNIKNGVAHNRDLAMKSPLLRVGGEGTIDIPNDTIDYVVKASIVATTKGQGGRDLADLQGVTVPVRITGPIDEPSYKLDFAALATEAAKQKVETTLKEQIEKRLGGAQGDKGGGSLGDRLKGLFGR